MYVDAGFIDYLSKPVDSSLLEKMLYEIVIKRGVTAALAEY